MGMVAIDWIAGVYGAVGGLSQPRTGYRTDRIGRKIPICQRHFPYASFQPPNGSGVVNGTPFFRTARTARQSGIT